MSITYAKLDPSAKGFYFILSNGDLTANYSTATFWGHCRATIGKPISEGGKWYWEHTIDALDTGNRHLHGFVNADAPLGGVSSHGFPGLTNDSCGIRRGTSGEEFYSGSSSAITFGPIAVNDVIGHELDLTGNTYRQAINGVWQGYVTRGFPATVAGNYSGSPDLIYPAIGLLGVNQVTVNFGQSAFAFTPPSGAKAGWFEEDGVKSFKKLGRGLNIGLGRGL